LLVSIATDRPKPPYEDPDEPYKSDILQYSKDWMLPAKNTGPENEDTEDDKNILNTLHELLMLPIQRRSCSCPFGAPR
jgi:hypothetical protein